MNIVDSEQSPKNRAVDALKATLNQLSAIKLRRIELDCPDPDVCIDIEAHVDVWGESHVLVCKVEESSHPVHVRTAIHELENYAGRLTGNVIKVLIAPRISAQALALCEQSRTSFLDLEGNARLTLGEAFIVKRRLVKTAQRTASSDSRRKVSQLAGAA